MLFALAQENRPLVFWQALRFFLQYHAICKIDIPVANAAPVGEENTGIFMQDGNLQSEAPFYTIILADHI